MTTALVFGVFDGLHEGHKNFLLQALKECDELIVVVTLPEIVQALKGRQPKYSYEERVTALQSFNTRLKIVPSDSLLGSWEVLKKHKPDIVFLGYDQQAIAEELKKQHIPFRFLEPHQPEKYKSSLMK